MATARLREADVDAKRSLSQRGARLGFAEDDDVIQAFPTDQAA
jgi:hypothetical protein